ncbi:MAG: hypothetical protein IH891_09895 [Planctomycetes bacterium]|nr:hypothetical protein [Planctomycetota bacterium]
MTGTEHGAHIGFDARLASNFRGGWDFSGYLDIGDQRIEPEAVPMLLP